MSRRRGRWIVITREVSLSASHEYKKQENLIGAWGLFVIFDTDTLAPACAMNHDQSQPVFKKVRSIDVDTV